MIVLEQTPRAGVTVIPRHLLAGTQSSPTKKVKPKEQGSLLDNLSKQTSNSSQRQSEAAFGKSRKCVCVCLF